MSGPSAIRRDLLVHSAEPLNAEPPLDRLRSAFVTPADTLYIRSHGGIPDIDPRAHKVRVTGQVRQELEVSLADVKNRFDARTVTAVMQCAGNRRADLQRVEPTAGDPWGPGAIGNVAWTGAPLADLLRAAGASEAADLHVAFDALDIVENEGAENARFGASIPMTKALDRDVLLAWAMNGAPLPREHGAPMRIVAPGYAGVRSAKWIGEIRVQGRPSDAFQQRHEYLLFPADMRKETQDLSRGATIYEMPLNSAICEPQDGAMLTAGETIVRGYAVAGDQAVVRVDLSADGGRTWREATIEPNADARWSWTFWRAAPSLAIGDHELVVRAMDAAGRTQPATLADTWNFKGYLCSAWHRVQVRAR